MNESKQNAQNRLAAIEAIKNKFISSITKIYINSLDREVSFREITVAEQKKLSRIMIDNEQRKDIVYDAQCATLQAICLEKDLDIYSLTEFDKIKLLMLMYQRNMMKHDISFVCPECGTQNKYQIDFQAAIDKLDKFDLKDVEYKYENRDWKFDFVFQYPTVKRVSDFYQQRYKQLGRASDKKQYESLNTSINMDYINLFIKSVKFSNSGSDEITEIKVDEYSTQELLDIVSVFPQDVLYSENGIITYITNEFISKINDVFDKHECAVCRHLCENTFDQGTESFF